MERAFTNILCNDVERTAQFYQALLGLKRQGDYGWFVLLATDRAPNFALGLLNAQHETVPQTLNTAPAGIILTFVVEDVHPIHAIAMSLGAEIVEEPKDLFYGQRRLLLRDPEGCLVDVSAPIG
ncbi:MAG: VOC family protein [Pseudomonadota bacterium]